MAAGPIWIPSWSRLTARVSPKLGANQPSSRTKEASCHPNLHPRAPVPSPPPPPPHSSSWRAFATCACTRAPPTLTPPRSPARAHPVQRYLAEERGGGG
uniref:Uncharacterized protein n=1 Tax=Mesocestoides corti TaxID=53468 RepID=A0A5K3EL28_MESCO